MGYRTILSILGISCFSGLAAIDIIADKDDVVIYYYNQTNINTPVVSFPLNNEEIVASYFNATKPSLFIIHGWNNGYASDINTVIKAAVLNVYDVNVFVVDWSVIAINEYSIAVANVAVVGDIVGQFINDLVTNYTYPYSSIRLVGHSLGAHVSGHAGRTTNSKVASIVGLDPAGPLYGISIEGSRMKSTDAQYVQIIHTNAAFCGYPSPLGVSDFWPNGGFYQPGCIVVDPVCPHYRSFYFYAESIASNGFVSNKCSSYTAAILGTCISTETAIMGGYAPNSSITGNFYLKTNSASPYARNGSTLNE